MKLFYEHPSNRVAVEYGIALVFSNSILVKAWNGKRYRQSFSPNAAIVFVKNAAETKTAERNLLVRMIGFFFRSVLP